MALLAVAVEGGVPEWGHGDRRLFVRGPVAALDADEPVGEGVFPDREARTARAPSLHRLGVGAGRTGKPGEEVARERSEHRFGGGVRRSHSESLAGKDSLSVTATTLVWLMCSATYRFEGFR